MYNKTKGAILRSCAIAGLFAIIGYSAVINAGCNSSGSKGNSSTPVAATEADKIKAIQDSNMPDQAKQTAIAMVKAHSGPGVATAPTAPTN